MTIDIDTQKQIDSQAATINQMYNEIQSLLLRLKRIRMDVLELRDDLNSQPLQTTPSIALRLGQIVDRDSKRGQGG